MLFRSVAGLPSAMNGSVGLRRGVQAADEAEAGAADGGPPPRSDPSASSSPAMVSSRSDSLSKTQDLRLPCVVCFDCAVYVCVECNGRTNQAKDFIFWLLRSVIETRVLAALRLGVFAPESLSCLRDCIQQRKKGVSLPITGL